MHLTNCNSLKGLSCHFVEAQVWLGQMSSEVGQVLKKMLFEVFANYLQPLTIFISEHYHILGIRH